MSLSVFKFLYAMFYTVQVKGFRVSDATQGSIQRWISARDEGLDGDLAMPAGLEATAPKEDTKLNQVLFPAVLL